jgi:hypothetical protein
MPGFFPNGVFSGAGRTDMAWTASLLQDYVKNKSLQGWTSCNWLIK